ncbi:MAG TPA: hypothetical protein ENN85_04910 [Methanoculleus sp.]|nr:hypothetical protein [Methanoculleus sp.]
MKPEALFGKAALCVWCIAIAAVLIPAVAAAAGESGATACECDGCEVTVTLKVAFAGADWDYIDRFADGVREEWNGDASSPSTCGECRCPFQVKVLTEKVDCCGGAPAGYHCIEVTTYAEKPPFSANESVIEKVRKGEIDEKTSDLVTRHRGYLQPPGVSTGDPLRGWWSDIMGTPVGGQKALDFAHEAGHMMGLDDGAGGIMDPSGVTGPGAGVTPANIDAVVAPLCGGNACPDRCCCGNGQIDAGKAEACDPLHSPSGCDAGTSCCPVCCNCFAPRCTASCGEYASGEACAKDCDGPDEVCAYNYHTGCWDCVGHWARDGVVHYAGTRKSLLKANESEFHPKPVALESSLRGMETDPSLARLFAHERIVITAGDESWHAVTAGGRIVEFGAGPLDDPTVRMHCDQATAELLECGEIDFWTAFDEGLIEWEGVGLLNRVKFGITRILMDRFGF